MMLMHRASRTYFLLNQQAGQSLTEFLVVTVFLLLPLFLLIPVLAGIMSQKQDVELGSRYAAWERTSWNRSSPPVPGGGESVKSDEQIAREIDARIFAVDTQIIVSQTDAEAIIDPFSRLTDTGESLMKDQTGSAGSGASYAQHTASETEPGGLTGASDDAFAAFGQLTRFELKREGMVEAAVSVELTDLNRLFDLANVDLQALTLSRTNALFVEAWTGGNKRQVEYLISGLTPQQYLDNSAIGTVLTVASVQPYGKELAPDKLKFGHADIDPLPAYRIGDVVPAQ